MPKINYTRPHVTDYQREIMDCEARFACIEASTKAGKTACMIMWLFEQSLQRTQGQGVDWVAPVFAQAKIAFDRMRSQISVRDFFKTNESRLTLTLPTGAIINFKSADNPDSLYGNDSYATVVDEASRMKEASWIAVRSTLTATRGKCKLIGNVKGRKNFFYKMALRAKAGEPDYFYKKITAYDAAAAGILDPEEIEQAKRDLPEHVFRELYLAEASEDGSNPFGLNHIARCVYPQSSEAAVCFGIDVAKSFDYTVIIGLDKFGQVCYFDRFQSDWRQTTQVIINLPPVPIIIDATGVGDPIAEEVQRQRDNVEAFKFTQSSKQRLMEGLAYAVQNREISFPDGIIRDEMESFEFVYTRTGVSYSAPEGMHDDCVCSLALAKKIHTSALAMGDGPNIW